MTTGDTLDRVMLPYKNIGLTDDDFRYRVPIHISPGTKVDAARKHFGPRYPEPHETIFPGFVDHTGIWMLYIDIDDGGYWIAFKNESDFTEFSLRFA